MLPENKAENDNSPQKPHNKYSEYTVNAHSAVVWCSG